MEGLCAQISDEYSVKSDIKRPPGRGKAMVALSPAVGSCHARSCPVLTSPARSRSGAAVFTPSQQVDCHVHLAVKPRRCVSAVQSTTSEADQSSSLQDGAVESYEQAGGFTQLVRDASTSVIAALRDGCKRMEVEFPPLSAQGFDANFKSSDEYIDANVQLALSSCKNLRDAGWKRIHVIVPDKGEFNRSYRMFRRAIENTEGVVTMGYLLEGQKGLFSGISAFSNRQNQPPAEPSESAKGAEIFMAINITSADLPALERYVQEYVGERALILWNLELDTLRSDLGLFGFPKKDLQYRFLSSFKPVFYIRPREYSKSIAAPPYVVNYSGCLFRSYPGPWQCMLNEPGGQMVSVAERQERFNLGEVKEELLTAMGLNTEAEGSALAFLRRGYKTSTWWEDARKEEKYADWRT